jgi:glutamate--cysteine ligase
LAFSGKRGHEMMKGTASIHLHVVIRNVQELFPLFSLMCDLSTRDGFRMQKDRKDIWNNTDPSRCGLPYSFPVDQNDPAEVIHQVARVALEAEDLGEGRAFYKMDNIDFDSFLYHLTTIFTDVRLNLKGPTVELRTLDSMPVSDFTMKLMEFISLFEAA